MEIEKAAVVEEEKIPGAMITEFLLSDPMVSPPKKQTSERQNRHLDYARGVKKGRKDGIQVQEEFLMRVADQVKYPQDEIIKSINAKQEEQNKIFMDKLESMNVNLLEKQKRYYLKYQRDERRENENAPKRPRPSSSSSSEDYYEDDEREVKRLKTSDDVTLPSPPPSPENDKYSSDGPGVMGGALSFLGLMCLFVLQGYATKQLESRLKYNGHENNNYRGY